MDKKRRLTQLAATFIYNANLKGFSDGMIYRGRLKSLCLPGLNCYSCPGAIGSCPIGTLQATMGGSPLMLPVYAIGFLLLFGVFFGRFICGWLCPFGLLQELLNKIPSKKLRPRWKRLRFIKYIFLAVFVVLIPLATAVQNGYAVPGFCKYICPAGTIEAGWPLVLTSAPLRESIGILFGWKTIGAIGTIGASIVFFRPFCRLVCPLGVILGWFNRISLIAFRHSPEQCSGCGRCNPVCKMELSPAKEVCSAECIQCGKCARVCSKGAIRLSLGKVNF